MMLDDTIAAIASAAGGAARGIVRISGPAAIDCLRALFEPHADVSPWPPHAAAMCDGTLIIPVEPPIWLPVAAYVWPTDRSYSRQPTVELHLPGSPPLVEAVLAAVCRCGARPARPGEFTLRAFLAGRLDLTQAEAVLGVVDAVDRRHLDAALRQMSGGLAEPLHRLRNELLDATAHLEAGLDFVEEDIEFIAREQVLRHIREAVDEVDRIVGQMSARTESNEVPRVVLVGRPNVGKSSLFNALVGSAGALVSSTAGTTRDYLTARLRLGTMDCELIDTAGVDGGSEHGIERAAQTFTNEQSQAADVSLLCLDSSRELDVWEHAQLSHVEPGRIVVWTKADLATAPQEVDAAAVSVVTTAGLDELRHTLAAALVDRAGMSDVVAVTAVRCRDSLQRARDALLRAAGLAEHRGEEELVAFELRTALDELGQVAGAVYTDDVLDRIFSRFCIGK
jgi:tRNA modification GTPase